MPTPPISVTPQQAVEAYAKHGTVRAAAAALGISTGSMYNLRKRAQTDPAVQQGMDQLGMRMVPDMGWIKTNPTDDGPGYSFRFKIEQDDDTLDRIREAFEGMTPAMPVAVPDYTDADLLTVYPIADAHVGMMAWGRETGEDYDTATGCARVRDWVGRCVAASPASKIGVILGVGDLTHADDQTNQTPRSKHALDVDTRHFRTLDMTIAAMCAATDLALHKHDEVVVRILPGNHDPAAYMAVMFAMSERYRLDPRVTVQKVPGEHFVYRHGKVLIAAHHGDKAKAERLVLWLADEHAEEWGQTRHRFLFTGHLHHHKSADIGGVQWEQLRAVAAKDAYAAAHAFTARAQLQGITFHKDQGEVQRVKVTA